jgi:hypothetical protein
MIVPKYWSESKASASVNGRTVTLKRFGWSDVSEQEAQQHAIQRLEEAISTLNATGEVRKVDHKVAYNGGEGIPIREEVISKQGDIVISRNAYGALCLNTPNVMFADVDIQEHYPTSFAFGTFLILMIIGAGASWYFSSWLMMAVVLLLSLGIGKTKAMMANKDALNAQEKEEALAVERFQQFSKANPESHLRIYKTAKGYRVLFMDRTYDPSSDEALQLLESLHSDKVYIQMCRNQLCFRARLTPKPWRMGMQRLRPSPGIWPINPEFLEERSAWVEQYEKTSQGYATCYFVTHIGSRSSDPKAEAVRKLHDELCCVHAIERSLA